MPPTRTFFRNTDQEYNRAMRNFFIALAILLGIVFVIGQYSEVHAILETLQQGDFRFIILAFLVQLIWMFGVALSYRLIYKLLRLDEDLFTLFGLATAANFVNIVAPSAGMGGMVVFVSRARSKSYSTGRAAIAGALFLFFDYLGFLFVLTLGILVLVRRHNLDWFEIAATIILLAIFVTMATLIFLGVRSADHLARALVWMARKVNHSLKWVLKRDYLSEQRATYFARDAADGLKELRHAHTNLLLPILLALINKVLLIFVLACVFWAFNVPLTIGTLIAGFSISYLFMIVSITPSGIGVVEGILTLTLRSLNVPLEAAAVVALAYRGFSFWLPMLVGMITFRWMGVLGKLDTALDSD